MSTVSDSALTFPKRFIKIQSRMIIFRRKSMAKKFFLPTIVFVLLALIFFGCAGEEQKLESALESITAEDLAKDVEILSSDEYEGRFPATKGEEKTIQFLKEEFEKLDLKPGNGESFFQEVPMVEITADPETKLEIKGDKKSFQFTYGSEFVAVTLRVAEEVNLADSEMVFVGYEFTAISKLERFLIPLNFKLCLRIGCD